MDRLVGVYRHLMGADPHASAGELAVQVEGILEATAFDRDEPRMKARFAKLVLGLEWKSETAASWREWRHRFARYARATRSLLHTYSATDVVSGRDELLGIYQVFTELLHIHAQLPGFRSVQCSENLVLSAEYYTDRVMGIVDALSIDGARHAGLLTEGGRMAMLMAVDEMMSPWSFLRGLRVHHSEIIKLKDDDYTGACHSDTAFIIHHVLEEVINLAMSIDPHGTPRLHFTWNQRRGAIELHDEGGELLSFLRDDPIASDRLHALYPEWWIEKSNGTHRMVIPTMSREYFRMWERLMADAWPLFVDTNAMLNKVLKGELLGELECSALDAYLAALEKLKDDIERITASQRSIRTVEREVGGQFFAKVNNWLSTYLYVKTIHDAGGAEFNSKAFRNEVDIVPRHPRTSVFDRISGSLEWALPNLSITSPQPPPQIIPANTLSVHGRFDRLVYGAAQLAGGLRKNQRIELNASWDDERSAVAFDNPDGRYASFLADVQSHPHVYPPFLTSLFDPAGGGIVLAGAQILLPMQVMGKTA